MKNKKNRDLMLKKITPAITEKILTLFRLNLTPRQLCDLELLMNGGFAPLTGFLTEKDYLSVIKNMRLSDGTLWPMPVVLDVFNGKDYKVGSEIILCDEYGKPLAIFKITSIYKPDKKKEAKLVYGTTDKTHFGVSYLMHTMYDYYLGGTIQGINPVDRYDFAELRTTPQELKKWFVKNKWKTVIAFQTRNPLHQAHFSIIKQAADQYKAKILLHPSVGLTKDGDIDYITRVRCYSALVKNYMQDFAKLSLLPLAMRMGGPREALWHAIIRKNFGATHFIIGRDHAGPGNDKKGKPFYGPYDAQKLVKKYERELGITIIPFSEMVYVEEKKRYLPINKVKKSDTIKNISGTQFRQMLHENTSVPDWFSFPEVIKELQRGMQKQRKDGLTIFFTGLSGAGKSTIAKILYFKLLEMQDKQVTLLDGDVVRQNLSKGLSFTKDDRNENIKRIGFVANEITKHRGIAICAAIAPYEEARAKNRDLITRNGKYIEVYISTPIEICMKRDVKSLYKKAGKGLVKGMTGLDDPYESPINPEISIDTTKIKPQDSVNKIIDYLIKNKLIQLHN